MSRNECSAELLIGRQVHDPDGAYVGRIEEFVAGTADGEAVVKEFLTGERGLLERLGVLTSRSAIRGITWVIGRFRAERAAGYAIRWDQLDLTDPEHPRTTVTKERLAERE